jgi:hypothetical protein
MPPCGPGGPWKVSGEFKDTRLPSEVVYKEWLRYAFVSAAVSAMEASAEARVAGGVGRVPGLVVNRRERTPDGRTIIGWNPDAFVDEDVPVLRIDGVDGKAIATILAYGSHPVVVGPDVSHAFARLRGSAARSR